MNHQESIKIQGHIRRMVYDAITGMLIPGDCKEFDNIVTTAGKNKIVNALNSSSNTCAISHLHMGSGSTTPAAGDTDVETAVGSRMAIAESSLSGTVFLMSFNFGTGDNNGTWRNYGLFDAATGGTMFSHALDSEDFVKTTSKTAVVDYSFTLT